MCAPAAPDMTAANTAAAASAKNGEETLAWYKQIYADDKPMRDKLAGTAYQVAQQQLASSKTQDAMAKDYDNYNKTTFRPLEQGIVADAANYDTPEKRQAAAESAVADTNMAFAGTNAASARQLAASGVDPGSTRAMSVMQGQGVDQAVASAGAAYKARKGVETVGHGMKMDAASLGRGLASSQATSAQIALTAGNNAVANTGVPITASNNAAGQVGQGFNAAGQGYATAGNLYTNIARTQAGDGGAAGASAIGSVAGAAAAFF